MAPPSSSSPSRRSASRRCQVSASFPLERCGCAETPLPVTTAACLILQKMFRCSQARCRVLLVPVGQPHQAGTLMVAGDLVVMPTAPTINSMRFECAGRPVDRDPLQSSEGWQKFTAGWLVGGLSGVAWGYILTQILPYCEFPTSHLLLCCL